MKKMNLLLAVCGFVFSMAAQASWFQEECSTANQSLTLSSGHDDNALKVKVRNTKGVRVEKEIGLGTVDIENLVEKKLDSQSRTACFPDSDYGFATSRTVTYRKVRVRNTDGSAFDSSIEGLSEDGLSVEADLICEWNYGGEIFCAEGE